MKKLQLNRETLRVLDEPALRKAAGGQMQTAGTSCPVTACICLSRFVCKVQG